ncbi:hypothetical protein EYF80_014487 [Liparis tanakae]|uniref:Uncharacterized protein n=1 Tax=Liparis tanakae TaxID=230148 RepID=A0A4Z2IBI2_9TELE|nr:hypothetical protein EYF80_014487 [Liparis tanakae]
MQFESSRSLESRLLARSRRCFLNVSMAAFTGFSMKCSSGYMPRYSCKEREGRRVIQETRWKEGRTY